MDRVETGIPGLDEMIGGGLKRGSSTLVVGGCGCGKTTLCLQYLYNGVTMYEENGVFISFNEQPEVLKDNMSEYGWELGKLEEKGRLSILMLDPSDLMQLIREDYGEIRDIIKEGQARRLVIDPISTFNVIVKDIFDRKMALIKFCEWLRKNECTTLMTSEFERTFGSYYGQGFEEYIVDCVIVMYNIQVKNVRQNALEVLKMRGSKHYKRIVPFTFEKGIHVSPEEKLFWQVKGTDFGV
jgi:circadian clock protein KaiC